MPGRDARREIGGVTPVGNGSGIDEAAIAQPGSAIHRQEKGLIAIPAGGKKLDAIGVRFQLTLVDDDFKTMAALLGLHLKGPERNATPSRGHFLLPA